MYKYNCRKCPIRNRCIEESENSPSIKQMLRYAFDARTDTLKAWDRLQRSCLLLKAEEERAKQGHTESLLSRRLREAREGVQPDDATPKPPTGELPKLKPLTTSARPKLKPLTSSNFSQPTSRPATSPLEDRATPPPPTRPYYPLPPSEQDRPDMIGDVKPKTPLPPTEPLRPPKAAPARPHWFTLSDTNRHIVLPLDGELVLGRFDPTIGIPPDIDLGYEDRGANTISRRHARITGTNGTHTVEDLGSRLGILLNGKRIESGRPYPLQSGNRVTLGQIQLVYDAIPTPLLLISPTDKVRHTITITPTGRRLTIVPPKELVIGRPDAYVSFAPDIDLSQEGDLAARVSRRHAAITWRNQLPYLEDLGSGFGTRLNGEMLLTGQAVRLKPGDHISLAGCVLAYDVEL
jgi:pSer/pThr/pTyr-binding forkhead associated (FHA) protein